LTKLCTPCVTMCGCYNQITSKFLSGIYLIVSSTMEDSYITKSEVEKENSLWDLGFETIRELETEQGILASGKEEIYGCIFGRDSLITSLKLLRVYEHTQDPYFLMLVKKILINLAILQGKEVNIESGEEPGKCIHEYRPSNHSHLTKDLEIPWYVYEDNSMRNYDSIDSTPLFLITIYRYFQASNDAVFIEDMMPHIQRALEWLIYYGDKNGDGFIDYGLSPERKHGGLTTQSWMDSSESVFHEDESAITFPIAPVEAQSYTFLAFKLWSTYFKYIDEDQSNILTTRADTLKSLFNNTFVLHDDQGLILAAGLDGNGKLITSVRSSMGHCLWASLEEQKDGVTESILNSQHIASLVERMLKPDLFAPKAGIRTLSTSSRGYSSNSYHNGSIWPHDTSIVAEGFEIFGFLDEARQVRDALISAMTHFRTPIELFVFADDMYSEYCSPHGQYACKKQAWSAASLLKEVTHTKN
jgi:glycogen debranching enzyme